MITSFFVNIGKKAIAFMYFLGGMTNIIWQTVYWAFIPPYQRKRIFEEAKKAGFDSLPLVSLIALFIGVILSFQIAYIMKLMGSELYIASIVTLALVRELGPVITSLVVAGRVGAAIAAEIGSMQVTEQVDALETLAANPIKYLVVPRFLALSVMLPLLTVYADIIGIIGGWMICVFRLDITSSMYFKIAFDSLAFKDLFTGLTKTIFFGMLIASVSCYQGFNVEGGAEGVGRATTKAVVTTFIMIIACDAFFTAMFYFIFP
jgi:phospholipid/cholesterol/gamma-HCH transport system permease protein